MVKLGGALIFFDDSRLIALECLTARVDSNWDRTFSHCLLKLISRVFWNIHITLYSFTLHSWLGFTNLIFTMIRVFILALKSKNLDITEGVIHKTSFTAQITLILWAVYELLSRKLNQLSVEYLVATLHCANSGECPVWATMTLILNRSHRSFLSPIDWV